MRGLWNHTVLGGWDLKIIYWYFFSFFSPYCDFFFNLVQSWLCWGYAKWVVLGGTMRYHLSNPNLLQAKYVLSPLSLLATVTQIFFSKVVVVAVVVSSPATTHIPTWGSRIISIGEWTGGPPSLLRPYSSLFIWSVGPRISGLTHVRDASVILAELQPVPRTLANMMLYQDT